MISVGLVGGRGYVGAELLYLLDSHPEFEVHFVGSSSLAGELVSANIDKNLSTDLTFESLDSNLMKQKDVDVWVLAQSNGEAKKWVKDLDEGTVRFIDISADFRFSDEWAYGLPERNRDKIRGQRFVSNPGCYATAVQLALLPLTELIHGTPNAFGVSGYSGAGKTPSRRNDIDQLRDNLMPYSLTGHLHEKEISSHSGKQVHFMPHVASFFRGISTTVSVPLLNQCHGDLVEKLFTEFYVNEAFVEVQSAIPELVQVREKPSAIVGGFALSPDGCNVVVVSVIDNLLKGAASQAVQNLNLMFDLEESLGLS